jgi:hypothetical protein
MIVVIAIIAVISIDLAVLGSVSECAFLNGF